jgi:hypothetical protein
MSEFSGVWKGPGCTLAKDPAHRIATVTGVVSDPADRMTLLMKKKDVHGLVSGEHAFLSPRLVKTNKVLRMPPRQEPHRAIRMGEPLR